MSRVPWVLCVLLALSVSGQETTSPQGESALPESREAGWYEQIVDEISSAGLPVVPARLINLELRNQIVTAAKEGDVSRLRELMTARVSPNIVNSENKSALYLAAGCGKLDVVKFLIQFGADVEQKNGEGKFTALQYAAEYNHTAIVRELLANGADCNTGNIYGSTALHLAARYGNVATMQVLMENSCDINATVTRDGQFPLHYAAQRSSSANLELLLSKGATVDSRDKLGYTSLHGSAQRGFTEVIRALIRKGADINAKSNYNFTPLHSAARWGTAEAVKVLLDCRAKVNERDNGRRTPLAYAKEKGDAESIRFLTAAGGIF